MATAMKSALVKTPVSVAQRPARASRTACIVRAEKSANRRDAVLAAVVGVTSLWAVEEAQAVAVPYQESIKRKQMTSTAQSASGYAMEGTKKGGISARRRQKLLAKARKQAELEASS
ncbi:hypothetical protein BSKO_04530 [Bryopsis sp. KO-2023]|nr:hypothetical protein BSKO_04530 [Bryopsis sp. KO-2023]